MPGAAEGVGVGPDPRIWSRSSSSVVTSLGDAFPCSAPTVIVPMPRETVATMTESAPAMARFRRGSVPIQRPRRSGSSTQRWVAVARPIDNEGERDACPPGKGGAKGNSREDEHRPVPEVERVGDPPQEPRDGQGEPAPGGERGLAEAARDHEGAPDRRQERGGAGERRLGARGRRPRSRPCASPTQPRPPRAGRDPGQLRAADARGSAPRPSSQARVGSEKNAHGAFASVSQSARPNETTEISAAAIATRRPASVRPRATRSTRAGQKR